MITSDATKLFVARLFKPGATPNHRVEVSDQTAILVAVHACPE